MTFGPSYLVVNTEGSKPDLQPGVAASAGYTS